MAKENLEVFHLKDSTFERICDGPVDVSSDESLRQWSIPIEMKPVIKLERLAVDELHSSVPHEDKTTLKGAKKSVVKLEKHDPDEGTWLSDSELGKWSFEGADGSKETVKVENTVSDSLPKSRGETGERHLSSEDCCLVAKVEEKEAISPLKSLCQQNAARVTFDKAVMASFLLQNKDAPVSSATRNQCAFRCKVCGKQVKGWCSLKTHCKTHHGKTLALSSIPTTITKVVLHECKICFKKFLCDQYFVYSHIHKVHILNARQYEEYKIKSSKARGEKLPEVQEILAMHAKPTEKAQNMCEFTCSVCGLVLRSIFQFRSHVEKAKGHANMTFGIQTLLAKSARKLFTHKCKICGKVLLCDSSILTSHIKRSHGISLSTYRTKLCGFPVVPKFGSQERKDYVLTESMSSSDTVGDFCTFECLDCNAQFGSWYRLKKHVAKEKHSTRKKRQIDDVIVERVRHNCRLCSQNILCDTYFIRNHLSTVHKSTIFEYLRKTGLKFNDEEEFRKATSAVAPQTPVDEHTIDAEEINLAATSNLMGNASVFTCLLCPADSKFANWRGLLKHGQQNHKQTISFSAKSVVEARYHKCLLCSKAVLCDNFFLNVHIKRHEMSVKSYKKMVREKGGKVFDLNRYLDPLKL